MHTVKIYQVNDALREYQWLQKRNLSLLKIRNYEDTKLLMKYVLENVKKNQMWLLFQKKTLLIIVKTSMSYRILRDKNKV